MLQARVEREELAEGHPEREPAHHLDRDQRLPVARRKREQAAPGEGQGEQQGEREREESHHRATPRPGQARGAEVLVDHPEDAGRQQEDRPAQ